MAQPEGWLGYVPQFMPPLTTSTVISMRKQMGESKHDMVNMLIQKSGIVFNPSIQNTNHTYQQLAHQLD